MAPFGPPPQEPTLPRPLQGALPSAGVAGTQGAQGGTQRVSVRDVEQAYGAHQSPWGEWASGSGGTAETRNALTGAGGLPPPSYNAASWRMWRERAVNLNRYLDVFSDDEPRGSRYADMVHA